MSYSWENKGKELKNSGGFLIGRPFNDEFDAKSNQNTRNIGNGFATRRCKPGQRWTKGAEFQLTLIKQIVTAQKNGLRGISFS
jgi:hypothetical protein